MLKNVNNFINERVKTLQQQLRAKDERIASLETENAMLYLKLAQREGTLRSLQYENSYRMKLIEEGDKERTVIEEKIKTMVKNFQALKFAYEELRSEIRELPHELQIGKLPGHEGSGIKMLLNNLNDQNIYNINLQNKLLDAENSLDIAMRKLLEERNRRRTLHNTLVELQGNIRVFCRVRPLLAELDTYGEINLLGLPGTRTEQIIDVIDEENVVFKQKANGVNSSVKTKSFEFERVFREQDDQKAVFHDIAPLLTSLLDGYNVCIMAYGQTGSGKTHTMLGDHSLDSDVNEEGEPDETKEGIIPRSGKELFGLIKERESYSQKFSVEVSVFEVYNNEIRDLLGDPVKSEVKHAVFSASDGSQEIPTLTTRRIHTEAELTDFVRFGLLHRHEDRTQVHEHSSRSHLIVQLNIYQYKESASSLSVPVSASLDQGELVTKLAPTNDSRRRSRSPIIHSSKSTKSALPVCTRRSGRSPKPGGNSKSKQSTPCSTPPRAGSPLLTETPKLAIKTKLQLVDLAGSECVGVSGVTGAAFRETSNINKSLSALADVLQALAENQTHVPYRNTKLTHVLQDTIGGDSKLVVMLCVSPAQKYGVESLQCLGFGSRARQVARGQVKKRRPSSYTQLGDSTQTKSVIPRSSSSTGYPRR